MDPVVISEELNCGKQVITAHSRRVISTNEYFLAVDRTSKDNMWLTINSFYKKAIDSKYADKLTKELVIQYTGEYGADSGALRREFFEDALKEMNTRLFDGGDSCRVPKKDWTFELLFEICGMLIAHSILQSGPGFPCLSPAVYTYLISGNPVYCFPVKDEIPLDLTTHILISFINKVLYF